MYTLKFILKQHTPIIHFQHVQDEATLRATEVKPKLDKSILNQLGSGNYADGIERAKNNNWLVGKGDVAALNLKITLSPVISEKHVIRAGRNNSIEPFFGNIGEEYRTNEKALVYSEQNIHATILTRNKELYEYIINTNSLETFFALNNFGTRQSKGFGSFSVININNNPVRFPSNIYPFYFELPVENNSMVLTYKILFKKINWFYKSLRSGLNEIRGQQINSPKLYFKSLLYQYAADYLHAQWDKKTVKKHFLNSRQSDECTRYEDDIVCNANAQNQNLDYKNFKDLFGLSSLETWGNAFTLTKTQAKFDEIRGRWRKITNKNEIEITRFKSPMSFKIIRTNNQFRVYFNFQIDNTVYREYINSVFSIERNNPANSFFLPFYQNFDYNHYINWILDNIDVENRFVDSTNGNREEFQQIISTLTDIFEQLNNNRSNRYYE